MRRSKMARNISTRKKTGLLSTDDALSAPNRDLIHKMQKIISGCADQGISIAQICEVAGVRDRQWRRWQKGQAVPRPSSLRRMERAIKRLSVERSRAERGEEVVTPVAYRLILTMLARQSGLKVEMVMADNPHDQDKQSPDKAAASLCRQRALYLIVTELNVPLVVAASYAGISKQAVSKSLRQIEESRDDQKVDRLLDDMAGLIHGECA